ncbi:A/G-specific adenine glycosylase [Candidatus Pelagibacter sp.]|nr:A/G-specific adenine glycosylase [Candidatus Pelagibacter sp.]MDC6468598.1 A/G-specific adenine glycosylase [Candidatus Pelagibacter sp.]
MTKSILTKKILHWYDNNKRSLPWRKKFSQVKREYYTLVSEFMLQQTQVATVIPYFNNFIKDIPNVSSLAKINENKLLKYWEGLGYYSRVKNLKKTAQILEKNFKGRLPSTIEELKLLPGVGEYTANAIMAIGFNKPFIPLDGNIERVIKRLLNLKLISEVSKEKLISKKKILGTSVRAGDYAQALMELGALICRPKNPLCKKCPLIKNCKSFKNNDFEIVKDKKKRINKFYKLNVYKKGNQFLLIRNTKFNFLKNFKIFPMYEISKKDNIEKNLNFKISNMNMNITLQFNKIKKSIPDSSWIDSSKLDSYTLPTFTKKIFSYLKKNT